MTLSQTRLDAIVQLRASPAWFANATGVIRVVALDRKILRITHLDAVRARWELPSQDKWISLDETPSLAWQTVLPTPKRPGRYRLQIEAELNGTVERLQTEVEVVQKSSPDAHTYRPPTKITVEPPDSNDSARLRVVGGDLLRGLPNRLVWASHATTPPKITYRGAFARETELALLPTKNPSTFGFELTPQAAVANLTIEQENKTYQWQRQTLPAFFGIRAVNHLQGFTSIMIEARDNDRNFFVDVWAQQGWLYTMLVPGGQRMNEVKIPRKVFEGSATHFWVQAYRNPIISGNSRGGRFVRAPTASASMLNQLSATRLDPNTAVVTDLNERVQIWLDSLEPPVANGFLYADTSNEVDNERSKSRESWLTRIGGLIHCSTVLLVGYLVSRLQRHRLRVSEQLGQIELDECEGSLDENDTPLNQTWLEVILFMLFVTCLLGGSAWLIFSAKWG